MVCPLNTRKVKVETGATQGESMVHPGYIQGTQGESRANFSIRESNVPSSA